MTEGAREQVKEQVGNREQRVARRSRTAITEAPETAVPAALTEFDRMFAAATAYSRADILPANFKGKPENVLIAMEIANRVGQHWLAVAQNLYVVQGRPGWMTSYLIGLCRVNGVFDGPITWETTGEGETLAVTAKAKMADGSPVSETVTFKEAKADGWVERNAKYKSLPGLMLKYRSASRLIRLYAPEVAHGMLTVEEIEDMPEQREVKTIDVAALASPPKAALPLPVGAVIQDVAAALAQEAQDAPATPTPAEPRAQAQEAQQAQPVASQQASGDRLIHPTQVDVLLDRLDDVARRKKVPPMLLLAELCVRVFGSRNVYELPASDVPRLRAEVDKLVTNVKSNAEKAS